MLPSLVTTEWVSNNLGDPKVCLVDATWFMPDTQRQPFVEYQQSHIEGAVFFDIEAVADQTSSLPHTLPNEAIFTQAVSGLGIGNDDHVIVYDNGPIHSGLRAWQLFRIFGHRAISYMDGGLSKWLAEGRATTSQATEIVVKEYSCLLDPCAVWYTNDIKENLTTKERQIIDPRAPARFRGEEAEPRPGLRAGHIPGSINVPFGNLFQSDGCFKDGDTLKALFDNAGTDFNRSLVTSCGSGVTACALSMALHLIGKDDVALYDGSWTEWGSLSDDEAPIAVGET